MKITIAADGGAAELIELADDGEAFDVAYSPDGAHLAFDLVSEFDALPAGPSLHAAEYGDIYVMATDGGDLTLVGTTALVDRRPLWAPDGTKLVFASEPAGE